MDDLEFNEALIAKRHKEVLSALKAIYDKLTIPPAPQSDNIMGKEIKRVLTSLEQSINQPKNEEIVEEIKKLSNVWLSSIEELKPSESNSWRFTISRDAQGFIKSVDAERKD